MNKYSAKKVTAPDGQVFDSKREYHRYCELKLLERAGKISNLQRQVKYELIPKAGWRESLHLCSRLCLPAGRQDRSGGLQGLQDGRI